MVPWVQSRLFLHSLFSQDKASRRSLKPCKPLKWVSQGQQIDKRKSTHGGSKVDQCDHLRSCFRGLASIYHCSPVSTTEILLNPVLFIPAPLIALAQMSCLDFFRSFPLSFPHLSSISHTATRAVFRNTDLMMAASSLKTPISAPLLCDLTKNF